jgi:hypothetical protein
MFPFCVQASEPGPGWWRLPDELHGKLPLIFSLRAILPLPASPG